MARIDVDEVIELVKQGATFGTESEWLVLRLGARLWWVTNAATTAYDIYKLAKWLNAHRGNAAEIRAAMTDVQRITPATVAEYGPNDEIVDPRDAGSYEGPPSLSG